MRSYFKVHTWKADTYWVVGFDNFHRGDIGRAYGEALMHQARAPTGKISVWLPPGHSGPWDHVPLIGYTPYTVLQNSYMRAEAELLKCKPDQLELLAVCKSKLANISIAIDELGDVYRAINVVPPWAITQPEETN